MKKFASLTLAIFTFAAALAHEPATLRHGYRSSENLALRGAVKQLTDYFSCDTLASGELVPDTTDHLYLIFDFDRAGNVIKEASHMPSRHSRRQDSEVYYAYDEQDRCVEERRVGFKDSHFVYDNRGLLIEQYEIDADGRKINHWAYDYDRKGRKVRSYPVDPDWDYIYVQYRYNRAGNLIKESRRYSNGKLFETKKMKYDRQGRMIDYRKQAREKDMRLGYLRRHKSTIFDYTPHQHTTYRYDERGNCVEEISYFPVNDIRTALIREFDAMDNCTDERFYQRRGDSLLRQTHYTSQYEYDQRGNWVKHAQYRVGNGETQLSSVALREISYYE